MKYIIGWESDGKKAPILWEKYGYRFPRLSPYHGFCCIILYCRKSTGKPMHFPYAEVYHRIGIGWEKSTHTMGKVWLSISQTFPIPWVLLHFPVLWEIYGENHAFPIWWHRLIFPCDFFLLTSNKFITKSKNEAAKKLCGGIVALKIPRKLTFDGWYCNVVGCKTQISVELGCSPERLTWKVDGEQCCKSQLIKVTKENILVCFH